MIYVSSSSEEELQQAILEAYKRFYEVNRLINFTLPMSLFLKDMIGRPTQVYGIAIQRKILYDSMGFLSMAPKSMGDVCLFSPLLNRTIGYEVKTSFLSPDTKTYRLTHTRDYDKFDYFLVCLIDQDDKFKERFYLLTKEFITRNPDIILSAMNGTSETNKLNENIEMSKTLSKEKCYKLFDKNNKLQGTNYLDWISHLNKMSAENPEMKTMMVNPNVNMYRKYIFKVNDTIISGKINVDTIIKFANHIGGMTAINIFPKHRISPIETLTCNVKLNAGYYYIDPHFTIEDIRHSILKSATKAKVNIKLI